MKTLQCNEEYLLSSKGRSIFEHSGEQNIVVNAVAHKCGRYSVTPQRNIVTSPRTYSVTPQRNIITSPRTSVQSSECRSFAVTSKKCSQRGYLLLPQVWTSKRTNLFSSRFPFYFPSVSKLRSIFGGWATIFF